MTSRLKRCEVCGEKMPGCRSHKLTCSPACRKKKWKALQQSTAMPAGKVKQLGEKARRRAAQLRPFSRRLWN